LFNSENKKPKARKSVKKPIVKKKSAKKPIKKQTKTKEKKPVETAKPSIEPQVQPTIVPQEPEKPPTPTFSSNEKNPMKINPLFIIIGVSVVAAGIGVGLFMLMVENAEQQKLLEEQEKIKIQQQKDLEIKQIELEAQELARQQQELELQSKELEQRQQQIQIERQQSEIQQQEISSLQQQAEIERQEILRQQQEVEHEAEIKKEKLTQLEILASRNPLLKKIMTGEVTFWAQSVPYYAAPRVESEVDRMLDAFESWSGVSRVYQETAADIRIVWVKDFNPSLGGQYWQSYVSVGIGQTGCYGEWQPFTAHTMRQILWHEIGHAMGYGHSSNPNNIMYTPMTFYYDKEFEDDIFLEDGHFSWRSFCSGGQYTFNLKGSSESDGFKFWVITPETDARKFINDNEGLHYPDCNEKGLWVSYTKTCNVAAKSQLLILNPRDGGKTINVDVTTAYTGGKIALDMGWDPAVLKESKQYSVYLASLR